MVHNEILITLNLDYKLVRTQDDVSYYIACGEGSVEPARTHSIARVFVSCSRFRQLVPRHARMGNYWRLLRIYAIRPNHMCKSPFLMVRILNPYPAELLLVICITVSGLKI